MPESAHVSYGDVAKMIDHSLLNPTIPWDDLEAGCRLALDYDVASVCILPYALRRAAEILSGSQVAASTTIGFPHGGHTTAIKVAEARQALTDADAFPHAVPIELDMVVNISQVLGGNWAYVRQEIAAVTEVAHDEGALIKVIFENAYLNENQKIALCEICGDLRCDWVKTSTGYAPSGATDADLILMRKHAPAFVQVKAAGGVRTLDRLLEVRALGVTRSGATRTAEMLDEFRRRYGREV
jgi:deoxyribose-phosphate aldolase